MPSRKMVPGDTGYVRMTVLRAESDAFQVLFEGQTLAITQWVPASECARFEDIGELRPPRRNNPSHIER